MINEECQILLSEVGKLRSRVNELVNDRDRLKEKLQALQVNFDLQRGWLEEWKRVAEDPTE